MASSSPSVKPVQEIRYLRRSEGADLYTALLLPANGQQSQVVLFCPTVFEEHMWSYPVLRECARVLAAHGVASLRFDYFGAGDSSGNCSEFSMKSAIADITFLSTWLADRFPTARIVPVGVRLGARFLLEALAKGRGSLPALIASPILWDPVLDANEYVFAELRKTLAGSMIVYQAAVASREDIVQETIERGSCEREGFKLNQVDGYPITANMFTELAETKFSEWSYPEPVRVIVTDRTGNGDRQTKLLSSSLPRMELQAVRDTPYWVQQTSYRQTREPLFRATEQCLEPCT